MIHLAGPLLDSGVQLCERCNRILTDYRNSMVPEGTPPLKGWEVGAFVEVDGSFSSTTEKSPDCEY